MLTMPGRNTSFGRLARTLTVGLVILAMAFLGACGDDQDTQATQEPQPTAAEESAAPSGPPIQVVATTNFVADWARVVGGDRVEVFGMLPAGGDPHSYQPGARDVARVADADVVFTVGLELETLWLEDLIRSASADESRIVALGEVVDPMEFAEADMHDDHDDHGDHSDHEEDHSDHEEDHSDHEEDHSDHEEDAHGHDDHHDHHHGTFDPHFWFDPIRVKIAVNEIAARLSAIDPENADFYSQNASEYGKQLDELHAWTMEQISAVAPERRLLVTSHDAFSYFAEAYGFEIVGLVIPSLAPDVEPSAEHIAGLVEVIEEHGVPALFGETTVSDKLAQAVARETGASLVQLYSGSLGAEGSGADTYLTMVRANVERIVGALK
ncbi:MAG: zinc ABC transporter substrate-binding protein [Acidimicrobiia bacterium]|nr:zinc ABC transporter substrate-binding protein [Acidimicrobiia bacterium]MYD40808.1 zinc ABC transporter substrate-binding protein [Acidimicrobiia bacterium]